MSQIQSEITSTPVVMAETQAPGPAPSGSTENLKENISTTGFIPKKKRRKVVTAPVTPEQPVQDLPASAPAVEVGVPGAKTEAQTPAPDPFDPAALRLSQDFEASIGVQKLLTHVPVRKPSKELWVQTHPDEDYRITTGVLELKEDREIYLIAPQLRSALMGESTFGARLLITSITRQGIVFLWPVRLPNSEGRSDEWNRSALEAATKYSGQWIRVEANMRRGSYDVSTTSADIPAPQWPETPFRELLRIAFKDHYIDSLDHPVLRRLRGEI